MKVQCDWSQGGLNGSGTPQLLTGCVLALFTRLRTHNLGYQTTVRERRWSTSKHPLLPIHPDNAHSAVIRIQNHAKVIHNNNYPLRHFSWAEFNHSLMLLSFQNAQIVQTFCGKPFPNELPFGFPPRAFLHDSWETNTVGVPVDF